MPAETRTFLEAISLEPAELKFCERLGDRSRIGDFRKHSHPFFEIILFSQGKTGGDAGVDALDVSPLDVVIYPPDLPRAQRRDAGRSQQITCLWADLGPCPRFDHAIELPDTRGAFRQLFDDICDEFAGHRRFWREIIACHLRTLVWLVRQHFAEPATERHLQVEQCLCYIHENYVRDFPVAALANAVLVSPSYLFRIFRKRLGVTPMHYRNLVRVEKAKLLLLDRTLRMGEVAEQVGFEDVKYFARVFRKETGASPSEFRARNGVR
jgi:AraC-like DNA-binding protein